jgi:hypothetical protein
MTHGARRRTRQRGSPQLRLRGRHLRSLLIADHGRGVSAPCHRSTRLPAARRSASGVRAAGSCIAVRTSRQEKPAPPDRDHHPPLAVRRLLGPGACRRLRTRRGGQSPIRWISVQRRIQTAGSNKPPRSLQQRQKIALCQRLERIERLHVELLRCPACPAHEANKTRNCASFRGFWLARRPIPLYTRHVAFAHIPSLSVTFLLRGTCDFPDWRQGHLPESRPRHH